MTSQARGIKQEVLNDGSVADYLQTYPDFFERNSSLLTKLRLPHLRFDGMSLNRRYEKWRIDRAKRKFQVYMRKQDSKREPWIH